MTSIVTAASNMHSSTVKAEVSSDFTPMTRLVWAKLKSFWWPAFYYTDLQEFNNLVTRELDEKNDQQTKARLAVQILKQHLSGTNTDPTKKVIRFLGRPVSDFEYVDYRRDDTYRDFFTFLPRMMQDSCRPEVFASQRELYLDFHIGFDEATAILQSATDNGETTTNLSETWLSRAENAWNDFDHNHHQVQHPNSPMANNSVAAVSLAEDSTIASVATPHTHATAASSPPISSPPPLETSPIRGTAVWSDVWDKLVFSGWTQKRVRHPSRPQDHETVYFKPNDNQTQYTLGQVQAYAQENYGWQGRPRATRSSTSNLPSNGAPAKDITFGKLWIHLQGEKWTRVPSYGAHKNFTNYYYLKPGQTYEGGVQNKDWFLTHEDVMEYCRISRDYPETSSSEGESSSPGGDTQNEHTECEDDNTTLDGEDDDTTLHPHSEAEHLQSEAEDSYQYLQTPRDSHTRPRDPQKPRHRDAPNSAASTESSDEETVYHWKNLWARLKSLGWTYSKARNKLEDHWYYPPKGPNFENEKRKDLVLGQDYFNSQDAVIAHARRMDGLESATKQSSNQGADQAVGKTRRKVRKGNEIETNNVRRQNVKSRNTKEKGSKRSLKSSKSSVRKKQKVVDVKDISVLVLDEREGKAPWVRNPLPTKLHPLFIDAGFTFSGSFYYLPNESSKNYTKRFASSDEITEYLCTVEVGSYLDEMSSDNRSNLERAVAYAHVPDKLRWRNIRAITTVETMSFLGVLGYTEVKSNGSWNVPEAMSQFLESETYESLSMLILALRKCPILTADENNRRRRGSGGDLLTKDQQLALRLRIAEGLDGENWPSSGSESLGSSDDDEEDNTVISSEDSESETSQGDEENEGAKAVTEKEEESIQSKSLDAMEHDESDKMEVTAEPGDEMQIGEEEDADLMAEVDRLCTSVCDNNEAWNYLQKLGVKYASSSGYSIPTSDLRFDNMQDLVQHIFTETICCLDLSKRLPLVAVQRLHRWLKFINVKLNQTEAVVKALKNLNQVETIILLLEKIGIKNDNSSYYYIEKNGPEELMGVEDVINLVRCTEDLALINSDSSSRSRRCRGSKSSLLSKEEELTLRLWAAESDFPLPNFDEEMMSSDMEEDEVVSNTVGPFTQEEEDNQRKESDSFLVSGERLSGEASPLTQKEEHVDDDENEVASNSDQVETEETRPEQAEQQRNVPSCQGQSQTEQVLLEDEKVTDKARYSQADDANLHLASPYSRNASSPPSMRDWEDVTRHLMTQENVEEEPMDW